jgi:hypothetical protein
MRRTLVNLDSDDKDWLDREARARAVPMAELVRQAVRSYRVREESRRRPTLQAALAETAGIWRHGDGLDWQQRLRGEWDRPA